MRYKDIKENKAFLAFFNVYISVNLNMSCMSADSGIDCLRRTTVIVGGECSHGCSTDCEGCSLDESVYLASELVDSGLETHVHELGLGVHLEAALDRCINLEFKFEFLAFVVRVCLQSLKYFLLLRVVQGFSGDDSDLLLFVQELVELGIPVGDVTNE